MNTKKLNIDGNVFTGPNRLGKDELPTKPAVALITTECGEGVQILSVLESENIAKEVYESQWNDCWRKNERNGLDVYVQLNDDQMQRKTVREQIRDKRRETMRCEDFRIPEFE